MQIPDRIEIDVEKWFNSTHTTKWGDEPIVVTINMDKLMEEIKEGDRCVRIVSLKECYENKEIK